MRSRDQGASADADRATRPTAQAPAGLGDTASVPCAWTPGPIELRIIRPECRITVNGWSDGTFGIDRRVFEDENWNDRAAHTITHLRTGGVVCHVKGRVSNAKKIATILHKASWDFDDPAVCKEGGRQEVANEAKAGGLLVSSVSVRLPDEALAKIAKARGEQQ